MTVQIRDFPSFAKAVRIRFDAMSYGELYAANVDRHALWDFYLQSFPDGTNPMFRERTEHDCSCCKNFITNVGGAVSIKNGELQTVWGVKDAPYPYDVVAQAMDDYVKGTHIQNIYRTDMRTFGAFVTPENKDGKVINWHHFNADTADKHYAKDVGPTLSLAESSHQVLSRGLETITIYAIDTVIELIGAKSLYRGEEHLGQVESFRALKFDYQKLNSDLSRNTFAWASIDLTGARIRNTVIGTLLVDLSSGMDLESAVAKFETKVAPENYKRPTALITESMIKNAMSVIDDLNLRSALERRHARLSDMSINDVIFVDNSVQHALKDGLEEMLMQETAPRSAKGVGIDIGITEFVENIVPKARCMHVDLSHRHQGNFVSMTAPQHTGVEALFKWGNNFAWSYAGEVADSIKARVEKAGGNVKAKNRISLSWFNKDDLDIHITEPDENHIFYGNPSDKLDVDMNVSVPVRDAVENVSWPCRLDDGKYTVSVDNYRKREHTDNGFEIEVVSGDVIKTYRFEGDLKTGKSVDALTLHARNNVFESISAINGVVEGAHGSDMWGVSLGGLTQVSAVVNSPNHWDSDKGTGNHHWFFILDGCKNPDPVRGIYNEFLKPALESHRKVFEVLGSKTKCQPSDEQMSGVGFTAGREDSAKILVNIEGKQSLYNVTF